VKIVIVGDGHWLKAQLTELDHDRQTELSVLPDFTAAEPAALVIADHPSPQADLHLTTKIRNLWESRLEPFARNLALRRFASIPGAPVLAEWSPEWATTASRLVNRLAHATRQLDRAAEFSWDHIGSTSVPELAAKPIIDLQLGVPSLDHLDGLTEALLATGFVDVAGVVPHSPGVLRDMARGAVGPGVRWDKRLFASADPGQLAILHVRQLDSPWWSYTIRFRDLLRSEPETRRAYERTKRQLTEAHSQDPDYDRYTLAKTPFFDMVQSRLDA
jgi:dephospho-CoA kinase